MTDGIMEEAFENCFQAYRSNRTTDDRWGWFKELHGGKVVDNRVVFDRQEDKIMFLLRWT